MFDASGAYARSTDPDAFVAALKTTSFTGGITIANGAVVFNEVGDNPMPARP